LNLKQINSKLGHRRAEHAFYVTSKKAIIREIVQKACHVTRVGSSQFSLCTEKTYLELINVFGIAEMEGFKSFEELKEIDNEFKAKFASTFNLWEGKKYKSNILKYKKDYTGHHPTQKPVLLLEDLIKTFSNENDLVVDLTMGSGSTLVACQNTNRNGIGIEMDENYFNIAKQRLNK
jgi:adenine specific DNA methylase Mod